MKEIMDDLKSNQKFVHQMNSSDIPYHSPFMKSSAKQLTELINKYVSKPGLRSTKWVSTSIEKDQVKEDALNYAGAEYFVNNLISPVFFYDKFKTLPSDAIVVEVGPHGVFRKIVSETLESATYITLIKKDSNDTNLDNFLASVTQLHERGFNPSIENLYPKVEFPVSRNTQSIGSLMKWDHSHDYHLETFPDRYCQTTASDFKISIDLKTVEDAFYSGHCIDGNIIFPATGYLMLAWKAYAASIAKIWTDVSVAFEQVQLSRALFLNEDSVVTLKVLYSRKTFDFVITENDNVCCRGKVYDPIDDNFLLLQSQLNEKLNLVLENELILTKDDIYKDLRVRGYDYSGEFQKLRQIRTNDFKTLMGECEWNGNMVAFLDNMLQAQLLSTPLRSLMIPVMIKNIRVNPKVLFDAIKQKRCDNYSSEIDKDIDQEHKSGLRMKEKFSLFESSVSFFVNATTRKVVAPGIEIDSVIAHPTPRRMPSSLVLDSYEWVANEDNSAINECDKQYINQYIEVIKIFKQTSGIGGGRGYFWYTP